MFSSKQLVYNSHFTKPLQQCPKVCVIPPKKQLEIFTQWSIIALQNLSNQESTTLLWTRWLVTYYLLSSILEPWYQVLHSFTSLRKVLPDTRQWRTMSSPWWVETMSLKWPGFDSVHWVWDHMFTNPTIILRLWWLLLGLTKPQTRWSSPNWSYPRDFFPELVILGLNTLTVNLCGSPSFMTHTSMNHIHESNILTSWNTPARTLMEPTPFCGSVCRFPKGERNIEFWLESF